MEASSPAKIRELKALRGALLGSVVSPAVFDCLNTRLIIQLGVNLKDITAEQNEDRALLLKVVDTLKKMRIRVEVEGS